jgi:hypothetical protein
MFIVFNESASTLGQLDLLPDVEGIRKNGLKETRCTIMFLLCEAVTGLFEHQFGNVL